MMDAVMRRPLLSMTFAAFMLPLVASAAILEVEITGLSSDRGDVHIALYDDPATFPKSDGMLKETKVVIHDRRARVAFDDLPPGRYAVAVYHDENANHSFDQGIFGIPLEDYGFSNNARVFFAPPSFDAAAFDVAEPMRRIQIRLND
jgi:uncharacterized protein (DUF2141 family)